MFLALLLACGAPPPAATTVPPVDCFDDLVTALSTDAMEGRGIGTAGLEEAAVLIEERLAAFGLEDGGVGFRQPFEAMTGVALGDGNRLDGATVDADFTPLGFSSDGAFSGELVFAGYGIVAESLGYDDYAGLDVAGRVVLAMRYEPGEADADSPFDGTKPTQWSDLRRKALTAREKGAAALILVSPARTSDEPDNLPALRTAGPVSRAGLPVLQVTRALAERWVPDIVDRHRAIDADYQPKSVVTEHVVGGEVQLETTTATVRNVLGVVPGAGDLAHEVVVVGAHYDHLGRGGRGSMEPDSDAIHNGADDNASGTAAVVCGAGHLAADPPSGDRRTLLVLAFAAEEIGLGGSAWYADHPLFPLENTVAMVNLDMVGRVRDGKLQAMGTDTAPEWPDIVGPAAEGAGLSADMGGDGYGPSDQTSFYEHGIPVVHLFSGTHPEYHTPADDVETLNLEGGRQVQQLLVAMTRDLLTRPERPTYVKSDTGPRMSGDSRGYGAYFGSIPDMSAMSAEEGGVLLADVRAGGPADRAGVKGGDRLVGMAGREIQNLYDMTFILRDHRPGESVEVVVLRGGERLTFMATLGKRGAAPASPHGATPANARNPATHLDFSVGADPAPAGDWVPTAGEAVPDLRHADEAHLADLRRLTFGGENAEAYFAPDGRSLIFQRTPRPGETCDQQYVLDLTTGDVRLLSSGRGRTTCGYFQWPAGDRVIYATTEGGDAACPPSPDRSQGYVWPLYADYDLVWQAADGTTTPFLAAPGYDAEATACMVDGRIVFTSVRDGDLELYLANQDGSGLERLTDTPGYDGGAFFTTDCSALVWRASRPTGTDLKDYQDLLKQGLVRPGALEILWMDLATREVTQLTDNGAANFGPYPLPDGSGAVFSSNVGGSPREFDLWRVGTDAGPPARVTHTEGFDGFPMFSPDGGWIVFGSNRATAVGASDTDLYIAKWVP